MNEVGKYTISLGDRTQGPIIGDGNFVSQQFYAAPIETPRPVAPSPPSGFIGRDADLERLVTVLDSSTHLTSLGLWGVAGVGKSALAKALAHQVSAFFPDGCLWSDVRQAQGDRRAILSSFVLSLGQDPQMFPSTQTLLDRIRALLRPQRMLLVLDNVSAQSEIDGMVEMIGHSESVLVVTTRSRELAVDSTTLATEIRPLASQDAEQLLRRYSRLPKDIELDELTTRTAGIPFLLEACGRRIRRARPEHKLDVVRQLRNELLSPVRQLNLAAGDVAYREILMLSYKAVSPESQRVLRLMGMLSPQPVRLKTLSTVLDLEPNGLDETLDEPIDLALIEQVTPESYRLPGVVYALAAELARKAPDADTLYHNAVDHFRQCAEQFSQVESGDVFQAQLAHFMALFELALVRNDRDTLHYLTDLTERPTAVTGEFQVIYDTSWPLAKLDVMLKNGYLDQVDWRGVVTGDLHLRNAWLNKTQLAGSQLGDILIRESTLNQIDMRLVIAGDLHVRDAWLHRTQLTGSWLGDLLVRDSTLSQVDMRGTQVGDIHLAACNVEEWDLRGAQLGDLYLRNCRIKHMLLDDTSAGDIYFSGCVIAETDFSQGKASRIVITDDHVLINVKLGGDVDDV